MLQSLYGNIEYIFLGDTMNKLSRFIIWLCTKFTRNELEFIVSELINVLKNNNTEVKPKDEFKEKHPNYRDFAVDDKLPFTEPQLKKKNKNKTGNNY